MHASTIPSPFSSLDIYISHLKSAGRDANVDDLFKGLSTELTELEGESSDLSHALLEQLCNRFDEVFHLFGMAQEGSRLSKKIQAEGLPLVMRLIALLQPFARLTDRRVDYLLFAIELEMQLGAQEETILTYYLHILFSSPNQRFDAKSAASFRQFYDAFVRKQKPHFEQLLQHSIAKDQRLDKVRMPHVVSALNRIEQLAEWGVDPQLLITYYQTAKEALSPLSSRAGWSEIASIRNRINSNITTLRESQRKEGHTALEFQQEALAQYHADFREQMERAPSTTPEEVRALQERLCALFCTFFHDHLLQGPFMLLHPPFPEVEGEPTCAIHLLGSASRKELSLHSDFEAFFLIKRDRAAWDHCLEQIKERLHFLRTHREKLRHFLEKNLHYAQQIESSKISPHRFLEQLKEELKEHFQEATEPEQKHCLKSLIGQLPHQSDGIAALLQGALHQLNTADGSEARAFQREEIIPVNPELQKLWNLQQKILYMRPSAEEEEMTPTERIESRILTFLQSVIRDSFTGCSLAAVSQQRKAIGQAVKELAILFKIPVNYPTMILDQFSKKKILREQETEKIAFLFTQSMKGSDFAYMEQWLPRLKLAFFALGQSATPEGLESLKYRDHMGIHLDIPDFDGTGIRGVYRSAEAFAALQTTIHGNRSYTLEELTRPGNRGVPPNYWLLKSRPLEASHPKEDLLSARYSKALERSLDGATLRQSRALSILHFRLHCFEEKGPFDPNAPINIKADFIEFLNHAIGDLAIFFGFAETNTLDLIDRLAAAGKLSNPSTSLLKKAVADLYMMRIRNQNCSAQERKALEAIYWLVLFPLYAIFKSALNGDSLEALFVNIDLIDVAFRQAVAPEGSDWRERLLPETFAQVCLDEQLQTRSGAPPKRPSPASMEVACQLARYLVEQGERSVELHLGYYAQLFSNRLRPLRRKYLEGVVAAPDLYRRLAHHPNMYGYRETEGLKREALSEDLIAMTTHEQEEWEGISVEVKGTCFSGNSRYLPCSVMEKILTQEGKIKQGYGAEFTRGRVCRYQSDHCDLHFKQEPDNFEAQSPFHPGREQAASRLVMRLCGHGISFSELLSFVVYSQGRKAQEYFVLVSRTVNGQPLDPSQPRALDPKRVTAALLTLPLLVPGDGRAVNYIVRETEDEYGNLIEELVSIDNDVSLGQPAARRGWFNRVVYTLYSVLFPLFTGFPLEQRAIEEFLQLNPQLLLLDWFAELVQWNAQSSEAFASVRDSPISSLVLFDRGTGARLLLQMQELQEALKQGEPLTTLDLLKSVVCYDNHQVTRVGKNLYSLYSQAATIQGLKHSLGRDFSQSMSMSQSSMVNYQQLPDIHADFSAHLPQNGVDEMVALTSIAPPHSGEEKVNSCFNVEPPITPATQRLLLKTFLQQAQKELRLAHCRVLDDAMLIQLITKSGAQLEILDLRYCPLITDAFIAPLAQLCPNLKELDISHCPKIRKFPDQVIHVIRKNRPVLFPALERLHAAHCAHLTKLTPVAPRLQFLKANDNHCLRALSVANGAPANQKPAVALRYLNLSRSHSVPEADINQLLAAANHLNHLLLEGVTQLLDRTFTEGIGHLKELKQLHIEMCPEVSHQTLCHTLKELVGLEELTMAHCSQIEEEQFCQALQALPKLQKLYLLDHLAGGELAHLIAHSQSLKSLCLKHLDLSTCSHWDAATLTQVIETLQQLKSLTLSHHLESNQLLEAIEQIDALETLDLGQCGKVEESHLIRLLSKLRQLKRLHLTLIEEEATWQAIAHHPTLTELFVRRLTLVNHSQLAEEVITRVVEKITYVEWMELRENAFTIPKKIILRLLQIDALTSMEIDQLDLSLCTQSELIRWMPLASKIRGVKHLNLSHNHPLAESQLAELFTQMSDIESLDLSWCRQLRGEALAQALEKLTQLQTLNLSWCRQLPGEALAQALEKLTQLQTLNLSWCRQLPGEALAQALEKLTQLQTLNLNWCRQLPGEALAQALEKLTQLQTLDLGGCRQLEGEALAQALEKLTQLQTLDLGGCRQLEGEALAQALEKLTQLQTLDLSWCRQLRGEALAQALEKLTQLQTLDLSGCRQLEGEALAQALEKLTQLQTLNLGGCNRLPEEALAQALEKLTQLQTLNLGGCNRLPEEALAQVLEKLTQLQTPDLGGCTQLKGEALAQALEKLTQLQTLDLSGCSQLEGEALAQALEKLTQLQTLDLSGCSQLPGEALAQALEKLTQLQTLDLEGCFQLPGEALAQALEKLTQLQTLNLGGCNRLPEEALAQALEKLTQLQTLDLGGCNRLKGEALAQALEKLTQLQRLNLRRCEQLPGKALAQALEKLTQLQTLDLSGCEQLPGKALVQALEKLTQLQTLDLGGCKQLPGEALVQALGKLTQLQRLDLWGCKQLPGKALAQALEKLTQLQRLNLGECKQLPGEALAQALEKLTQLQTLNLNRCSQLRGEALAQALEKLTQLQILVLSWCRQLPRKALAQALEKLTQLQMLDLWGCDQLQGEELAQALEKLTQLQILDLGQCSPLRGEAFVQALEKLTQLQTLDLSWCSLLPGEALVKALEKLTQLQRLYLTGCFQLRGEALNQAIGKLQLLRYSRPLIRDHNDGKVKSLRVSAAGQPTPVTTHTFSCEESTLGKK